MRVTCRVYNYIISVGVSRPLDIRNVNQSQSAGSTNCQLNGSQEKFVQQEWMITVNCNAINEKYFFAWVTYQSAIVKKNIINKHALLSALRWKGFLVSSFKKGHENWNLRFFFWVICRHFLLWRAKGTVTRHSHIGLPSRDNNLQQSIMGHIPHLFRNLLTAALWLPTTDEQSYLLHI